jgi:hypothetical protein
MTPRASLLVLVLACAASVDGKEVVTPLVGAFYFGDFHVDPQMSQVRESATSKPTCQWHVSSSASSAPLCRSATSSTAVHMVQMPPHACSLTNLNASFHYSCTVQTGPNSSLRSMRNRGSQATCSPTSPQSCQSMVLGQRRWKMTRQ